MEPEFIIVDLLNKTLSTSEFLKQKDSSNYIVALLLVVLVVMKFFKKTKELIKQE